MQIGDMDRDRQRLVAAQSLPRLQDTKRAGKTARDRLGSSSIGGAAMQRDHGRACRAVYASGYEELIIDN